MDSVIPPLLNAIRVIRRYVESGHSVRAATASYLESGNDPFRSGLRELWLAKLQGQDTEQVSVRFMKNHLRRGFWDLLVRGMDGQPVGEALAGLEIEVERAAQAELDRHIASLPFKMLIPLLLCFFPAFLLILLGPMLRELGRGLGAP